MFNVIKYKYLFIGFSAVITVLAIASMVLFGFKQGIDFVGGTLWQVRFQSDSANINFLNEFFRDFGVHDISVRQGSGDKDFSFRTKELTEAEHQKISQNL